MSIAQEIKRDMAHIVGGPLTAFVCLAPVALLSLGALVDPIWFWPALLWMILLAPAMDRLIPEAPEPVTGEGPDSGLTLTAVLAVVLFPLMALAVWTLAGMEFGLTWVVAFFGFGLILGQVGMVAAHDLIHRRHRWAVWLGQAYFTLCAFGHHASAHKLIHHVHVATPRDPNTPRKGRTIYGFIPEAWWRSFTRAWYAESRRRNFDFPTPFAFYIGGALAVALAMFLWQGLAGLLVWMVLAFYAASQMLAADYVQHYGLWRKRRADGKFEPVTPRHSWDTPGAFTAVMMFHAGRHADHHAYPYRPYPALRDQPKAPVHPFSVATMVVIALIPPLWRRLVHPRLDAFMAQAAVQG
ncbi:MAG: alkane 1-monooxygenase [Pararhodobacter sp.]|nr:alkane 1-monooxygenase [Pararhodobacter sp.]